MTIDLKGLDWAGMYPVLVLVLLGFNFWFTVNRLQSSARIIGYIQVVLEGAEKADRLIGWETSLQKYRLWRAVDKAKKQKLLERKLTETPSSDSLRYYSPIYSLHIALICVTAVAAMLIGLRNPVPFNIACLVASLFILVVIGYYCVMWRPFKFQKLIDEEIISWQFVMEKS